MEMISSSLSPPNRFRSYVLLPCAVFSIGGSRGAYHATFAPSDYRLLLVGLPSLMFMSKADRVVEALNLKEDLLRGIYAYSKYAISGMAKGRL